MNLEKLLNFNTQPFIFGGNSGYFDEFARLPFLRHISIFLSNAKGDPVSAAIMAGGTIGASALSGKGSKSASPVPLEPAWQRELRKRIAESAEPGALERIERAGEPFPGELVAPLSKAEETGISQLGQYLDSPLPTKDPLFAMGKEEVSRTLGGEYYDPAEGPYYQALRKNVMRELAEAKDRLASRTAARDAFYGGGRIATEGELEETAVGGLAQILGGLYEGERVRRLGTVPLATEMLSYEERAPLGRIAASQQLGALPREWKQAVLDAEREEWLRQLTELGIPLDVAMGMATYKPAYSQPTYGPSPFSQAMSGLGPLFMGVGQAGGFGNFFGDDGGIGTPPGGWDKLRTQAGIN